MTFTDAAAEVLRLVGRPLHYKEITEIAIEKNLLSHVGKSPEVTMGARLAALLKKEDEENPLVRVKPGVFALRSWDEKTIRAGLEGKKGGRRRDAEVAAPAEAQPEAVEEVEVEAEAEAVAPAGEDEVLLPDDDAVVPEEAAAPPSPPPSPRASAPKVEVEDLGEPGPDDAMRAEAAARAGDLFEEEDDDDQPLLGGDDRAPADGGERGGRRKRRRRRGRGDDRGAGGGGGGGGGDRGALPTYTATPVGDAPLRGPQVIDVASADGPPLDDAAGRELSDAVAAILGTFDRQGGPVSLRQIAEAAQRRGRVQGEVQLLQSQVAACVRADNARRAAAGQRLRFRFAGGRVALTDWLLGGDLARLEQEALAAVERYREGARRALARKLSELPGHAFVELALLLVERMGLRELRSVRRPGGSGGEAHFSGVLRSAADDLKVAVVIRRDAREVGRERVAELRGSLQHYGPAQIGWIFTMGQALSGARDEANGAGAAPVSLWDGAGVARLCEEHEVAVLRTRLSLALPDLDLLEALRAS